MYILFANKDATCIDMPERYNVIVSDILGPNKTTSFVMLWLTATLNFYNFNWFFKPIFIFLGSSDQS